MKNSLMKGRLGLFVVCAGLALGCGSSTPNPSGSATLSVKPTLDYWKQVNATFAQSESKLKGPTKQGVQ